jgi:hypothetical protein
VVVVPLKRVSNASSVSVEPISTDDWELLEMNAEDIEAGALLNQISIVYPGQKLNITVNNISFNIQILKLGFISQNARDEEDECLRLVASTEIIVTPKPRGWDNQARSKTVRVLPHEGDYSDDMKQFHSILQDSDPSVPFLLPQSPPLSIIMHPSTIQEFFPSYSFPVETKKQFFVYIQKLTCKSAYARIFEDFDCRLPFAVANLLSSTSISSGSVGKSFGAIFIYVVLYDVTPC